MSYTKAEIDAFSKIRSKILGSRLFILLLLGIIAITLKLAGAVDWSWAWTTSPIWIGAIYFVIGLLEISCLGISYESQKSKGAS